uniref:Uncharacterized protein n=1 Tax=Quercus lobata TaxID=97700 RepID=A0A7N2MM22_QUELO
MIGLDDKKIQPVLSFEDFGSLGFDVNDELEQPDKLTSSPIADFRVPSQLVQRYVKVRILWPFGHFGPRKPQEFKIYSNSTFHIPVSNAHQAEVYGIQQDGLHLQARSQKYGKAEVYGIQQDGLHLQARSQKYGKLERGQLLTVPSYLVRRRKQHFHHLEQCGVDLILGCFNITIEVIRDTMNLSSSLNLDIHEMLGSEFCVLVAEGEAEQRSLTKKKG